MVLQNELAHRIPELLGHALSPLRAADASSSEPVDRRAALIRFDVRALCSRCGALRALAAPAGQVGSAPFSGLTHGHRLLLDTRKQHSVEHALPAHNGPALK